MPDSIEHAYEVKDTARLHNNDSVTVVIAKISYRESWKNQWNLKMFKRLQGKYLSLFLFVNRYIRLVMFWTHRLYVLMFENCYN